MLQKDVKKGLVYVTKVAQERVRVIVIGIDGRDNWLTHRAQTRFICRRLDCKGPNGGLLPKHRSAAALEPVTPTFIAGVRRFTPSTMEGNVERGNILAEWDRFYTDPTNSTLDAWDAKSGVMSDLIKRARALVGLKSGDKRTVLQVALEQSRRPQAPTQAAQAPTQVSTNRDIDKKMMSHYVQAGTLNELVGGLPELPTKRQEELRMCETETLVVLLDVAKGRVTAWGDRSGVARELALAKAEVRFIESLIKERKK